MKDKNEYSYDMHNLFATFGFKNKNFFVKKITDEEDDLKSLGCFGILRASTQTELCGHAQWCPVVPTAILRKASAVCG